MIGIDSMILIYAGLVPRKASCESEELGNLSLLSRALLHTKEKDGIVLPTVALSEILVPVPAEQRGTLVAAISGRFVCASFDLPAAAIAADLWSKHKGLPNDSQYDSRHVLKADTMIVATAKAAGATDFYSCDKKCRTWRTW